jgi:hypothetical protein
MGMTNRERILAALHRKPVDRIPFMHWWRHFPRGSIEREVRNRGMGLCVNLPFYIESHPNVEIVQTSAYTGGKKLLRVTYHTPIGSVYELFKTGVGWGTGIMGRDFKGHTPWRVSPEEGGRMVKRPEDYEVVKFIVEDTRYEPYYEAIRDFEHYLGEDGIVITSLPYSPFQRIAIEFVGQAKIYIDYARHRDKVLSLYEALVEKYRELYPLAAGAPVEYVNYGDNIDGVLVSPSFFERYYAPNYDEAARILHESGKVLGSHMDGRLRILAQAIARTRLDVIEAFTPPPMGDLPVREALSLWKEKVLWINYPSSVYVSGGPQAIRRHLLDLLGSAIPGDRILLAASTENYVPLEALKAITEVMEKAVYPISKEWIESLR